jgi:hypothetical protein
MTGAGFAKKGVQNLEGKELRGQNIDNKGLTALATAAACTASALTMICLSNLEGKVTCHRASGNFVKKP